MCCVGLRGATRECRTSIHCTRSSNHYNGQVIRKLACLLFAVPLGLMAQKPPFEVVETTIAEVHDAMSFYQFFHGEDDKLGKTRLWVCRTLACHLRGADDLLEHCSKALGIPVGGTTADGKITLEFAECIGACDGAPAVLVNYEHVMNVTPAKMDGLIAELRS